ncbi:MAG: hypothetical protein AAF542_17380 [Pseudomonadota bacterium]
MNAKTLKGSYCLAIGLFSSSSLLANEWTGEAGIESRYFLQSPQFAEQFDGFSASGYVLPEYYTDWNKRRDSLIFEPFLRVDQRDPERTHVDIRELVWRHATDDWELKLGLSTVFWGVTESQHLVDVINQTDAVENLDGEDKLGQPMAMLRLIRDWGTLDAYLLPGFRERTFPGPKGRLSGIPITADDSIYESSAEQRHTDLALRWSQVFGDWDVGLSYFRGTSREPRLLISASPNDNAAIDTPIRFRPLYEQIHQIGIDVQATLGAWLWKFEGIHRSGQGSDFFASTFGFEYSFYSVFGSDADIGVLVEYLYDDREADAATTLTQPISFVGPDNDVFLAGRFAFNDIQSSELLAGCSLDMDSSANFCIVEGSRRLSDNWVISIEARLFSSIDDNHSFATVRDDGVLQLDLTYHF